MSLMRLKMEPENPFLKQVRTIEQYVQDGAGLTRQLLTLAKGGALEIKPTDVNELIRKQSRMFGRTRKEITIAEDLVPVALPVMADSSQIEQVLLNLPAMPAELWPMLRGASRGAAGMTFSSGRRTSPSITE